MKKFSIVFIICSCFGKSFSQNTSSPYSIIGLGDIEKNYFDRTSGLGHAGVAMYGDRNLFVGNPASFSFLETRPFQNPFYLDLSIRYKNINYSGSPVTSVSTNQSNDLQFKRISFAIKPKPRWGLSFGLLPFSTTSYSFVGQKGLNGDPTSFNANYEGNGSSNLLYISNSYRVTKNLSIGVQSSVLFGQFDDKETISTDSTLVTERSIYLHKLFFKGGFIYKAKINKNWDASIGGTGSLKTSLDAQYQRSVKDGTTILSSIDETRKAYTSLPLMGTIGLAATYKNKYTIVLDYSGQNWSSLNYKGTNYSLINSDRISGGFQFTNYDTIRDKNISVSYEKNFLQVGFFYNNSYLNIYGQQIKEWGVTLGAGTQLKRSGLGLHATIEIGSRGTTSSGLIKENITQFGLTLSYRDFWYTKRIKRYN